MSRAVASGSSGNVYWYVSTVAGGSWTDSVFTVSPEGVVIGQRAFSPPMVNVDLATDSLENVLIAGVTPAAPGLVDLLVSKFDSLARPVWTWRGQPRTPPEHRVRVSLRIDDPIVLWSTVSAQGESALLDQFTPDGSLCAVKMLPGDSPTDLAVGYDGNPLVTTRAVVEKVLW